MIIVCHGCNFSGIGTIATAKDHAVKFPGHCVVTITSTLETRSFQIDIVQPMLD